MIEHFRTQLKARFDDNSHMFEDSEFGEYNPELEDDITEAGDSRSSEENKQHTEFKHGAVSMGNPHATFFFDDVKTAPVEKYGKELECHPNFPEKVNVGFAQVVDNHTLNLRVFERGCGTGACGAAVVAITQGRVQSPVTVNLPGGTLRISWDGGKSPVMMSGPATRVYEGTIVI